MAEGSRGPPAFPRILLSLDRAALLGLHSRPATDRGTLHTLARDFERTAPRVSDLPTTEIDLRLAVLRTIHGLPASIADRIAIAAGIRIATDSTGAGASSRIGMSTPILIGPATLTCTTPTLTISASTIGAMILMTRHPITLSPATPSRTTPSRVRATTRMARLRFTRLRILSKPRRIRSKAMPLQISNPRPRRRPSLSSLSP